MALLTVAVRDFRNIASADLAFSPQLNLITGANGAGKTSLLEALYFLGRGQSFRANQPATLIREGAETLLVRGTVSDTQGGTVAVGLQRDRRGLRVRMGGQPLRQLTQLVALCPFQILSPDSHLLLEGGPRHRRRFLDWGVFHVEPGFYPAWQRYTRALRQRNAALRARLAATEVRLWDTELVQAAETMDRQRRTYLDALLPVLDSYIRTLVDLPGLSWDYRPGWSRKQAFAEALAEGLEADRRQGFTRLGPHRADLVLTVDGVAAQERVSRGQQKQLVAALMLAQAEVYRLCRGRSSIFLVDDLASELDAEHRQRVLAALRALEVQVFITAIEGTALEASDWAVRRWFHVEHGQIQEVV
ncbi:MAG: DNA replication/repair protein RecF [Gammaproteobacteria bacterium]|nr:DNA replication/repair protein RecF [Gammaproteobacteria bacterium]